MKLSPTMAKGMARVMSPKNIVNAVKNFPKVEAGVRSPYLSRTTNKSEDLIHRHESGGWVVHPTVVMVTTMNHMPWGIESSGDL